MLTQKQYNLLLYINKFLKETGQAPSYDEMRDAIGLKSKSSIYALISSLEERGFLKKLPHKARALDVIRLPKFKPQKTEEEEKNKESKNIIEIPLYGKIAAGLPIEAISNETDFISIPTNMVSNGQYFALNVDGNSMVEAGIMNGDIAIIKKQNTADNGNIVVALIDNNEATLKIFKKENNLIKLIPCNREYNTQIYSPDRVSIQGILSTIIRQY